MPNTNKRTEFAQKVYAWCGSAMKLYDNKKSIKIIELPGLLAKIKDLESERQTLRAEIRSQQTRVERDELTDVYNFQIEKAGKTYDLHCEIINYI